MYLVAITLSPSVTQKFMRLGYAVKSVNVYEEENVSAYLRRIDLLSHTIDICDGIQHSLTENVRSKCVCVGVGQLQRQDGKPSLSH